jgi:hypothetical protein
MIGIGSLHDLEKEQVLEVYSAIDDLVDDFKKSHTIADHRTALFHSLQRMCMHMEYERPNSVIPIIENALSYLYKEVDVTRENKSPTEY